MTAGDGSMSLSVGILIIGSLYWESGRQEWRDERLRKDVLDVRAPIRYGRLSESRSNTYTMVFSRGCNPGQAKVAPCHAQVRTSEDLIVEAEHLWAAERREPRSRLISARWGCVALLPNPHRQIAPEILDGWAARVNRARPYGNISQTPGEGVLVNDLGILQVPWPALAADDSPVALDLLLATATQPTLRSDPPWYPTPQMIADRWRDDKEGNVRYFRNNVACGIRTFEDNEIREWLDRTASTDPLAAR